MINLPAAVTAATGDAMGEGPLWDPRAHTLFWVDIDNNVLHVRGEAEDSVTDHPMPRLLSCVGLTESPHTLVGASSVGFHAIHIETGAVTDLIELESHDPGTRMNDGKPAPDGSFWVGSIARYPDHRRPGTLYRIGADLSVSTILPEVGISNGMDWDADTEWFYFADSAQQTVSRYEFRLGSAELRGPFWRLSFRGESFIPDGLSLDQEGCLWVALFGGGAVRRYSPYGELLAEIALPVSQVTSCVFGGADLDHLYMTSARAGLSDEQRSSQPDAGSLFRTAVATSGRPPNRYRRSTF